MSHHITLQTRGMPRLLKVICLENPDDTLIHRLQQRRVEEIQTLYHYASTATHGGGQERCRGPSGYRRIRAILLQLMHQGHPAVCLENVFRQPTSGIGVPMDRQVGLCIVLECTRVLGLVHHDMLKLAVSRQVSPQHEGEMVLERFEARGRLLLPLDVQAFRHFLPLQAHFIHVEHLLGLVPPSLPLPQ